MSDPIVFCGFVALMALLVLGAYQLGFIRGTNAGFSRGLKCAGDFARLKRSEPTPRHNGNSRS